MDLLKMCLVYASVRYSVGGERVVSAIVSEGEDGFHRLFPDVNLEDALRLAERICDVCKAKSVEIVTYEDDAYPTGLRAVSGAPPVVYAVGNLEILSSFTGAVVGSRKPSHLGVEFTERVVRELASERIPIVSGLAVGVDQTAHRAALSARGITVAVLGTGIDVPYPRGAGELVGEIAREGLVLTQFPPGTPPKKHHFPLRNRIIAAISDFVCVMEAARKSGSLITARFALDFGKEVFAVPGHPMYPQSEGCNMLIKSGAHPLTGAEDVLDVFGFSVVKKERGDEGRDTLGDGDSGFLPRLKEPLSVDDLSALTGIPSAELTAKLVELEMEGVVKKLGDGRYVLSRF